MGQESRAGETRVVLDIFVFALLPHEDKLLFAGLAAIVDVRLGYELPASFPVLIKRVLRSIQLAFLRPAIPSKGT